MNMFHIFIMFHHNNVICFISFIFTNCRSDCLHVFETGSATVSVFLCCWLFDVLMMQVIDTFADSRQNDVQNLAEELEDEIEHDRHLPDRFKPKKLSLKMRILSPKPAKIDEKNR